MNIENKINELIEVINYHAEKYYNQDSPEISDYESDQLMNELIKLNFNLIEMINYIIGLSNILMMIIMLIMISI